ncbi:MAG: putative FmdB family regulatory protein [Halieaceae bacterium]|jgi:putative FmdB family regulatory protein
MPIYEYQCQACQHQLEALQKMNDEPLLECPTCGESQLKKKISAVAFRLKGSGWYETDFKTGDKKNIAGDAGSSKSADSTKSSGDSKPSGDAKSSGDSKPSGDAKSSTKTDKPTSSSNSPAASA